VRSVGDVLANVRTLEGWRSGSPEEQKFFRNLIKNGKVFVAHIEHRNTCFAPSKFAGYLRNDFTHRRLRGDRDGKLTNPALQALLGSYIGPDDTTYPIIDEAFKTYCAGLQIAPSVYKKTLRRYWIIGDIWLPDVAFRMPDEAEDSMWEGATATVTVNRFERSMRARGLCVAHYGAVCQVCDVRFEERYGEIGRGCIHVHHIVPLTKIGRSYKVDPVRDLRPVCPNCHWMLNRPANVDPTTSWSYRQTRWVTNLSHTTLADPGVVDELVKNAQR
jgi:5-methylcytosine-specific restriction protein A